MLGEPPVTLVATAHQRTASPPFAKLRPPQLVDPSLAVEASLDQQLAVVTQAESKPFAVVKLTSSSAVVTVVVADH